jgi:hypothetical protein
MTLRLHGWEIFDVLYPPPLQRNIKVKPPRLFLDKIESYVQEHRHSI